MLSEYLPYCSHPLYGLPHQFYHWIISNAIAAIPPDYEYVNQEQERLDITQKITSVSAPYDGCLFVTRKKDSIEYFLQNKLVMPVRTGKILFDINNGQSCTENLDNCGWMF